MNGMKSLLDWCDKCLIVITGGMLIFLTLMIVVDVLLRVLFNSPLPASAESTELIMPYIALVRLAYTLSIGIHVRISLFTEGHRYTCRSFLKCWQPSSAFYFVPS